MRLTRRTLLSGLGAVCAVLAATFLYTILAPLPDLEIPQVPVERKRPAALEVASLATPSPSAFGEINARPMFSPARKPIGQPEMSGTAGPLTNIVLVGVIMDPRDRMALVRTPASPLAVAFRLGADISGWQVTEIAADHIELRSGAAREEMRLEDTHAPKVANPAPAPMTAQ